ncbi:MAG: FmdE family protein, partial [Deltaproteobacteria bacterium]|nr:FmdE family protein [Deltaproteobacteria bacterium]
MRIGPYSFEEFKERAAAFHGYPAPGLLLGGYMVAAAQRSLPTGVLYEAIVETTKCLPDAVQLLTPCSTGNNWMKVLKLGRYAVSLFDKHSGEGFRVHLDVQRLRDYPAITGWFLKLTAKAQQDEAQLFHEIRTAGDTVCAITPVRIHRLFLGHAHMQAIDLCPPCGEAYPREDGVICRGCQGEAPYSALPVSGPGAAAPLILPAEQAVGKKALHDMTRVVPGELKDVAFSAGQTLSAGDVCRLQQMGRFHVAVEDAGNAGTDIHENAGAEAFARRMAGEHVEFALPPKEGRITLRAGIRGLLCVDKKRLEAFNMIPDVM